MIRKAIVQDASRLAEILIFAKRTAYRSIFQNDKVSFGEMQVLPLAMEFINCPSLLENIVVFDDEFVKGMATAHQLIGACGEKSVQLDELYVDPFFQKQGVGYKLLLEIQEQSMAEGATNIYLWVLEKNTNARLFYEAQGFQATDEKRLEKGTAEYILKYTKLL